MGVIAQRAKEVMPVTWTALQADSRYGTVLMQGRVDYVKFRLFGTICADGAEASIYNPLILDYVGKEVALQIIPAGIDYWMEQHLTASTHGTQESVSYPDRVGALEKLQEWLIREVRSLRPELDDVFIRRRKGGYPAISTTEPLLTPDPQRFGKPFDEGLPKNLPWGPAF